MENTKNFKFDTLMIHAGFKADQNSTTPPIYQTNAYAFDSAEHARRLFALEENGNIYIRLQNPTQSILEERITALEDGVGSLAVASGHAAIFMTMVNLASEGDEIVSSGKIYGGAINLLGKSLKKFGIKVIFADPSDPDSFDRATTDKTKAYFVESIGNPNSNLADLEGISKVAKKHNLPFIVDNTIATPYLLQPKKFGADIVIHSATKYLGGHGVAMGGTVTDMGTYDWNNEKFPDFINPDESYHGVVYARDCAPAAFITKLRTHVLRDFGPAISPFNSFLLLEGIETLSLRMQRHCENAQKIAEFLEAHPLVSKVNYPGLPSDKNYALAKKYLPKGQSAVFTFELAGGKAQGVKFIDSLSLFRCVANLGDARSMVSHPASTTHSQLSEEQLRAADISGGTIRLSIGLEDVSDLIDDLKYAIEKSAE